MGRPRGMLWLLLLVAWGQGSPGSSQEIDTSQSELTLERIFDGREFQVSEVHARWLDNGVAYAVLENSPDGGTDLVQYDVATGQRRVLVAAQLLVPPGQERPLEVDDYAWSQDHAQLLIYTNSKRVWRRNTRGDYWLLDRTSRELRRLGGDAPPASLMFANISPTGASCRVRSRSEYLGRRPARSLDPPGDHYDVARHHQRHIRLGV